MRRTPTSTDGDGDNAACRVVEGIYSLRAKDLAHAIIVE